MKRSLRSEVRKRLANMPEREFHLKAEAIHRKLFQSKQWKKASVIALTISRNREVPTKPIIEQARLEGKTVCIPKCMPETKEMHFRSYQDENDLEVVYFGLQEPIVHKTERMDPEDIDFILVPGICYDRTGYRIGYGGGYYDRYLADFTKDTASLAFECQVIDHVPKEPHDIPVKQVLTEDAVYNCSGPVRDPAE
ncbi:5-formyltetrahydrofolate cyclo-ligase [Bacillus haynesii]|uniref:5-formyltetrahydrofolate cyclo-ligase n=1 Tax=Bacillus haynesii TaxID=1925021 RepID=UPI00227FD670|nr:5-formyltetrahydrofolate cyclo-ligase [Bacillus haynesii]MCY8592704.1 5-formyltetrahydrofolate cyclo-ligase [Bacillus haynesii]